MYRVCAAPYVCAVWLIRTHVPCLTIDMFASVSVAKSALEAYSVYRCKTGELCHCAQCAMYGELKGYTSFVHGRSCSRVACTCEIDKGPFIYGCYTRM